MGTRLSIRGLTLETATDVASYTFHDGVNAVVGPIGTGKSSMLELIKFGLGGNAQIMPDVHNNVTVVRLEVQVGEDLLQLRRAMDGRLVDVHDARSGELLGVWSTHQRKHHRRAAQELMGLLGLPDDLRVPRRRTSPNGETVPLTFFDIYRYVYLSQNTIDISVVGHNDNNLDNKRRSVFELLYELSNPRLLTLVTQRGLLTRELERARGEVRPIAAFLREIEGSDESVLHAQLDAARGQLTHLEEAVSALRAGQASSADDPVQAELVRLRATTNDLATRLDALDAGIDQARALLSQLALDQTAFRRQEVAAHTLSGIDFVVCPRCLQSLKGRHTPADHCSLCQQPQEDMPGKTSAALRQLQDQEKEVQSVLEQDLTERTVVDALLRAERTRFDEFLARLHGRHGQAAASGQMVSLEEAARAAAATQARISGLQAGLARWSALRDREAEIDELEARIKALRDDETQLRLDLQDRSERVEQLGTTFDDVIRGFNMPWYETGDIDPVTYLPRLGGRKFDQLSVGGARKTLVNLAYHIANLIMSIEEFDVGLPTLLIVDSPRKNVGENVDDRAVAEAIYQRLRMLQDASPRPFQVIVADNDLPANTKSWLRDPIQLSYEHPLVPGVAHPGDRVATLASAPLSRED